MAASLLKFVVDGTGLILGNVVKYVQPILLLLAQAFVELIRNHLIGSALEWE